MPRFRDLFPTSQQEISRTSKGPQFTRIVPSQMQNDSLQLSTGAPPIPGASPIPNGEAQLQQPELSVKDGPFKDLIICVSGHHMNFTHMRRTNLKHFIPARTPNEFVGVSRGLLSAERLKNSIIRLGAKFSDKASPRCTHLVTTPNEVKRNSFRVRRAYNAYTTEIVSLEWLLDSQEAGRPLPDAEYSITLPNQKVLTAPTLPGQAAGVNRLLDDRDDYAAAVALKKMRTGVFPDTWKPIIPAHKNCPFKHDFSVFIDKYGHTWDAKLVQSTSEGTTNNYYHLQLLANAAQTRYVTWACWGRIGDNPKQLTATPSKEEVAKEVFEARFHQKTGISWWSRFHETPREGKYNFIAPGYVSRNPDDDPFVTENASRVIYNVPALECSLPQSVQDVLAMILDKDALLSNAVAYDARRMPLGQLSRQAILEAYQVLTELSDVVRNPGRARNIYCLSLAEVTRRLSSKYFSLVPHVFGKNETPVIACQAIIDKEMQLLDELADARVALDIMNSPGNNYVHELERELRALGLDEITPLNRQSYEFRWLFSYFRRTVEYTPYARCPIINIFRIHRATEEERYQSSAYSRLPVSHRILLWHGSRTTNFARILSQGLRVRPHGVQRHGSTLGDGLYFSDSAGMSLMYSSAGKRADAGLLLLCDVELGDPVNFVNAAGGVVGKKAGTMSAILAKWPGSTFELPLQDASCVHSRLLGACMPDVMHKSIHFRQPNEYVVYHPDQVRIRYLVHVGKG